MVAELEALDGQEECKQNSKAKQMSIGRKKFNMDPKKGEHNNKLIYCRESMTGLLDEGPPLCRIKTSRVAGPFNYWNGESMGTENFLHYVRKYNVVYIYNAVVVSPWLVGHIGTCFPIQLGNVI